MSFSRIRLYRTRYSIPLRNPTTLASLLQSNPIRTRAYPDIEWFTKRLIQKDYKHKLVVTLTEWEADSLQMGEIQVDERYHIPETCYHLEELLLYHLDLDTL